MTTLPEEAVKAAMDAFHEAWNNNQGLDNELPAYAHRAALTAALPFLSALEPSACGYPQWANLADQSKNEGRLSELNVEPGEVFERISGHDRHSDNLIGAKYISKDTGPYCQRGLHLERIPSGTGWTTMDDRGIFRRLSCDAGKVEGDGWLQKAVELYDRCKLFPETSAEGFMALLQLRNHVAEILPSAPASEGAE